MEEPPDTLFIVWKELLVPQTASRVQDHCRKGASASEVEQAAKRVKIGSHRDWLKRYQKTQAWASG